MRHDGIQQTTATVIATAVNPMKPSADYGIGRAVAQSGADATVWTELKVEVENPGTVTIVGLRLGVRTTEGGYSAIDVPLTIAPAGVASIKQSFARGTTQVGIDSCNLLRVSFSDGTFWYAPQPSKP